MSFSMNTQTRRSLLRAAERGDIQHLISNIRLIRDTSGESTSDVVNSIRDEEGNTALMKAAILGHTDIASMLVANKIWPDAPGARLVYIDSRNSITGDTAVHLAARNGNLAFIQVLSRLRADLTHKNTARQNPLVIATIGHHKPDEPSTKAAYVAIVQYLAAHGVDLNAEANIGDTALHIAVRNRDETMTSTILQLGAAVNKRNGPGDTALSVAARMCDLALVQVLLAHGADPNTRNRAGDAVLHVPMRSASGEQRQVVEVVEALIQGGADERARNANGLSPWELAQLLNFEGVHAFFLNRNT